MADPRTLPRPLSSAGAIVADSGPSLGLPLHYGWPADEQERFERGLGFTYLGEVGGRERRVEDDEPVAARAPLTFAADHPHLLQVTHSQHVPG